MVAEKVVKLFESMVKAIVVMMVAEKARQMAVWMAKMTVVVKVVKWLESLDHTKVS